MGHIPKGLDAEVSAMSDRSLTLLAIHLEDAHVQIGPKRIDRSNADSAEDTTDEEPAGETDRGGSARPIPILLSIVVVLATLVAIVTRVRGPAEDDQSIDLESEAGDD
jgi:hypothetical protein